jgi:hypothetical protein
MATPTKGKRFKGKLRNKIFLFMALISIVPLVAGAAADVLHCHELAWRRRGKA